MAFLKLVRFKNLVMILLTMVLVKYCMIMSVLETPNLSNIEFIIFALSVLSITAGGYIINDIFDINNDKINKPNKTYVGVSISIRMSWVLYWLHSLLGLGLATYISIKKGLPEFILLFLFGYACLFLYSKYFQKKILIGNMVIAFICGALIYLTYLFDFRIDTNNLLFNADEKGFTKVTFRILEIKFYMVFSFLGTLIREIIKDIEDIDGDYNAGYTTLPIAIGKKRARNISFVLMLLFMMLLIVNTGYHYSMNHNWLTIAMSLICILSLYMLYKLWMGKTKKDFHFLSNLMKIILLLGILSMFLFTFEPEIC